MLDAGHAAVNKSRSLPSAASAAVGVCVTDKVYNLVCNTDKAGLFKAGIEQGGTYCDGEEIDAMGVQRRASITAMGRRWGGSKGFPEEVMPGLDPEEEQASAE